jgi:hypothetical protein
MSSFVISKSEYVKAAGVVSGIADATKNRCRKFAIYGYQERRWMNEKDYYNRFVECFEMNAISVSEQYHDDTVYTDSNEYMKEFREYQMIGKSAVMRPDKLREIIFELKQFFSGAQYQTEKEAYFFKMSMFFNQIIVELMDVAFPYEAKSWSTLDLK